MSFDISRVSRAVSDLSVGSHAPLKLSHAQQCAAAAFGFKSLAAYQAAKKLETPVNDNGAFVIIESDLLATRARDLVESVDGVEVSAIVREAIRQLYPIASIHSSWNLRPVGIASAIAGLVGLDPISAPDFDDARYQVIENSLGEEQGFLFNFDEPDWEPFAAHIQARHGSLSVYAPSSFRRIVKGCGQPERFYLHGDRHEARLQQYFCRACDQFVAVDHLESGQHTDHDRRYFDALKIWDRAVARWKLPLRRAINAPNILAVRAQEGRLAAQAARGDFHRWIEIQAGRSDLVGYLAKDIMGDVNFPTHVQTVDELIGYIENVAQWDGPLTAAQEAWREFLAVQSDVAPLVASVYARMDSAAYVAAKNRSRVHVGDIWRAATGVTANQDWAWRNGRASVPEASANRITALLTRIETAAEELLESLRPNLPAGWSIAFDKDRTDLIIQLPAQDSQVQVERKGVDRLSLAEVYEIPGAAVFLRVRPGEQTMPMIKQPTWVLWRGSFSQGAVTRGPLQNYPNLPSEALLRQVLQRWI